MIDKVRLAIDLEAVAKAFHHRTAHRRMPSQRQMRTKLRKLAGLAASLLKELAEVERESWLRIDLECRAEAYAREHGADPELPPRSIDFGDGIIGLDFRGREALARVLAAVRRLDAWLARSGPHPELEFKWRSEIEQRHDRVSHWLFGHALADVYQRHFVQEAGVARPKEGGSPGGPYVRFALSAAKEIGVRKTTGDCYGEESVAKAQRCPDDCPGYDPREWEKWKPPSSQ